MYLFAIWIISNLMALHHLWVEKSWIYVFSSNPPFNFRLENLAAFLTFLYECLVGISKLNIQSDTFEFLSNTPTKQSPPPQSSPSQQMTLSFTQLNVNSHRHVHTHMHIKTWRHTWLLSHLHPIQHQLLTALLWKIFSVSPLFITSIINILVQDTIINQLDYWHNFHVLSLLPPYNIQSVSKVFNRSYHLSVQNPLASNMTQAKNSFFGPWVYLVYWL